MSAMPPRLRPAAPFSQAPAMSPLMLLSVRAGFPSPAEGSVDRDLNLHEHVVRRPAATYFVRAEGDSMEGDGIFDGDLLVVDKSVQPRVGLVVIASLDGEFTVKRLGNGPGGLQLEASNPRYRPIVVGERDCELWGVVTNVIHRLPGGEP